MSADNGLCIVVVDDDPAVWDSLRILLKLVNLQSVDYGSALEFLPQQDLEKVGCLILDVRLPGMSGLDLLEQLRDRGVDVPVLVVTGYGDVSMAVQALKAGVLDFLEKPFNPQQLLDRIQQSLQEAGRRGQQCAQQQKFLSLFELLTRREREVLEKLVAGKSNREIAAELGIGMKTLDIHRAKVLDKMQAANVPALVSLVWQFAPFQPALATFGSKRRKMAVPVTLEPTAPDASEKPKKPRGRPRKQG